MRTVTPLGNKSILETVKKKAAPTFLTLATLVSPMTNDSFTNRALAQEAAKIRTVSTTANPEPNYQKLDFSHLNLEDSSNPIIQKERIDSILRSFNQQRPNLINFSDSTLSTLKDNLFHRIPGVLDKKGNVIETRLSKITEFFKRLDEAYQRELIDTSLVNKFVSCPNLIAISNGLYRVNANNNLANNNFWNELIEFAKSQSVISAKSTVEEVTKIASKYD